MNSIVNVWCKQNYSNVLSGRTHEKIVWFLKKRYSKNHKSVYIQWRTTKDARSQFSSFAQSCLALCDPMNHSTQASLSIATSWSLLRLMSIESVMPSSHLLSSPSPPAPNPSRHQGLFQWVNSSHEMAKVLEFQLQHQSFQWTPRTDL